MLLAAPLAVTHAWAAAPGDQAVAPGDPAGVHSQHCPAGRRPEVLILQGSPSLGGRVLFPATVLSGSIQLGKEGGFYGAPTAYPCFLNHFVYTVF